MTEFVFKEGHTKRRSGREGADRTRESETNRTE